MNQWINEREIKQSSMNLQSETSGEMNALKFPACSTRC